MAKSKMRKQAGVATLATAVILLLVSTILILAVAKSTTSDQKNVGDELRTKELYQAAEAALEYAIEQLMSYDNLNAWSNGVNVGSTSTPINQLTFAAGEFSSGNQYGTTVTYTRMTEADPAANRDRPIFQITATAAPAVGDTHITRTLSTMVLRTDLFGGGLGGAGPILLEGSMQNTGGSGDLVPGPSGVAVTSLSGGSVDAVDEPGDLEVHGGVVAAGDADQPSLAEAMFGVDLAGAELDAFVAKLAEGNEDFIHYYDSAPSNLPNYPSTFDDPSDIQSIDLEDPANFNIVYFASQDADGNAICPKLNGGFHMIGLIYVASPSCSDVGFGNCHVYGTVAFTGDVNKLNANCQFIGLDLTGLYENLNEKAAIISPIPGTWRDY